VRKRSFGELSRKRQVIWLSVEILVVYHPPVLFVFVGLVGLCIHKNINYLFVSELHQKRPHTNIEQSINSKSIIIIQSEQINYR